MMLFEIMGVMVIKLILIIIIITGAPDCQCAKGFEFHDSIPSKTECAPSCSNPGAACAATLKGCGCPDTKPIYVPIGAGGRGKCVAVGDPECRSTTAMGTTTGAIKEDPCAQEMCVKMHCGDQQASDSHLDLGRALYVLYGVEYIGLVSLGQAAGQ